MNREKGAADRILKSVLVGVVITLILTYLAVTLTAGLPSLVAIGLTAGAVVVFRLGTLFIRKLIHRS
jgi:hypothetical protein